MGIGLTTDAARLAAQLEEVADQLDDLTAAHTAAARLVEAAARPRIPVATGRLAASGRPTGDRTSSRVDYPVDYAAPVHALRPWIPPTIDQVRVDVAGIFRDHVTDLVRSIT